MGCMFFSFFMFVLYSLNSFDRKFCAYRIELFLIFIGYLPVLRGFLREVSFS